MNESELPNEMQKPQATQTAKSRPRTGPIVWGCIFIAVCAFVLQHEFAPKEVNTSVWIAATTIGLGLVLLCVGVSVVVRNRGGQASAGTQ